MPIFIINILLLSIFSAGGQYFAAQQKGDVNVMKENEQSVYDGIATIDPTDPEAVETATFALG